MMGVIYCVNINAGQYKWATGEYFNGADFYEDRLAGQPEIARWRYGPGKTRGAVEIDRGVLRIVNADGQYDTLQSGGLEGKSGYCFAVLDDGTQVGLFAFICEVPSVGLKQVDIPFKDWIAVFDKPLLTSLYLGTGGIEGTSNDIQGFPRPLLMGEVYNVEPYCVNATKLIYEFHGADALPVAASVAVGGVYDRRAAITNGGTYAALADVENDALAPAAGQYKSYWGVGATRALIRLGSAPVGIVTADVTMSASTSGSWIENLVGRLLGFMSPAMTEDAQVTVTQIEDATSMDRRSSIYLKEQTTILQALNTICSGFGLSFFFRGVVGLPASGVGPIFRRQVDHTNETKSLALTEGDILRDSLRLVRPSDPEQGVAIKSVQILYKRNYRVMSKSDAPGATDATIAAISAQYRRGAVRNTFTPTNKKVELLIESQVVDIGMSDQLSKYWAGFSSSEGVYSNPVELIALETYDDVFVGFFGEAGTGASSAAGMVFSSGITVNVTHPRFGLSGGVDCLVLGYRYTGRRTVELILWKV